MTFITRAGKPWAALTTATLVCVAFLSACGSDDDDRATVDADRCQSGDIFDDLSVDSAEITGVEAVWNDGKTTQLTNPIDTDIDQEPFCELQISLSHGTEGSYGPDDMSVWVWLPEQWNGRLQAVGGGGTHATNGPEAMKAALADGYAVAASDAGVTDDRQPNIFLTDGTFDWQIYENWTHRSVGETGYLAQAAIETFYSSPAEYSYWNGCSNGGRQGLAATQRYPDLFDGVLSAAPAAYGAERLNMSMGWPAIVQNDTLGGMLSDCATETMTAALVERCDGVDGAVDGLVADPWACDTNAALDAVVGTSTACGVLTQQEADVAKQILAGPITPSGEQVWVGFPAGVDLSGGTFRTPPEFAFQNFAFADLNHDWTTVDATELVTDVRARLQGRLELLATTDPALDPYASSGGKLLMWHGVADGVVPVDQSIHYVDEVRQLYGSDTDEFLRFFLAPGVDHCSGGTGAAPTDPFEALVAWVEEGKAPETLPAEHVDEETGDVTLTRNLCLYPQVQTYDGGDVAEAASFGCADPES